MSVGAARASCRIMHAGVPLVVVADRDRLHEGLVTAALTDLGYEVVGARSPWELHHLIEARQIDVLLVDLALFGSSVGFLDGVLAPRRPPLVVLMLAIGGGFTPDVARSSGFDACFSKLVDVGRLDRFLRDHLPLSRRPARDHATQSR